MAGDRTPSGPAQRVLDRWPEWGRAPSAHNTQPWRVRVEGPTSLAVGWEPDRVLEIGDPTQRDLLLSLGCAIEAISIVAADEGYAIAPAWAVDRDAAHLAVLELVPAATPDASTAPAQLEALRTRRTARSDYVRGATGPQVRQIARASGLRLATVPPEAARTGLAVADQWLFDSGAADELREWLRLDPRAERYAEDGLSDVALGLSRWEARGLALAMRPRSLALLRATGATRALAAMSRIRDLGTVALVDGPAGLAHAQVAGLGRRLLRAWLAAHDLGLSVHPLSQLLDCPSTAGLLNGRLGAGRTAYAVLRIGVPTTPPPASARRTPV